MDKRYFRLKHPGRCANKAEWIEMSGKEFYRFIHSPEGEGRHFIDMGDIVLETTETEARQYRAEQNHHYYIQTQEEGWDTLSLYVIEDENGCSGEEVIQDDTQDVEAEAITRLGNSALHTALDQLDAESYHLIYALYVADERKSLRQFSSESGVPVMTLQDRKKKALAFLLHILS